MKTNQQIKTVEEKQRAKIDELKKKIASVGKDGIIIKVSTSWDGVRIELRHSEYNWTDFITVSYEKRYEDKYSFNFSHGSGGWNDVEPMKILKATQDMFSIVESLYPVLQKADELIDEISEYGSTLTKLYSTRREEESAAIENAKLRELKDDGYKSVTGDEMLELINKFGVIAATRVSGKMCGDAKFEWNRNKNRAYLNSEMIALKDMKKYVDQNKILIKK